MKLFDELDEENFYIYAGKYYTNYQCSSIEEFYEDVNRIKYIKRLLSKYKQSGVVQERLLLNHIIVFFNVFQPEAARKMLFYRIDKEHYPVLKTILIYLSYMPEDEYVEVPLDFNIVKILRESK